MITLLCVGGGVGGGVGVVIVWIFIRFRQTVWKNIEFKKYQHRVTVTSGSALLPNELHRPAIF